MIIGLGYKARSGKNTVADILKNKYGFLQRAFADHLKLSIHRSLYINPYEEDFKTKRFPLWGNRTGREILQQFGTDAMRNGFDKDIWVKLALYDEEFSPLYVDPVRVSFSDLRFENEATEIKKLGGILIRIDRDVAGLKGAEGNHASEVELDGFLEWDYILDNNGTLEDLEANIDVLMNDLGIKPL